MPWYKGPTLLEYLETVPLQTTNPQFEPLRFPIQLVVRPNADFRGFAGRVERGEVRPGLTVRALPSGRTTRVKSIVTFDGELKSATAPRSVTLELEDEIDLSRGEMLVGDPGENAGTPRLASETSVSTEPSGPTSTTAFRAMVVWMHETPLNPGASYLLKHTTRTVRATVRSIAYKVEVATADHIPTQQLGMNDIAEVTFDTALPLFFDPYATNREMGALILIDPISNATVGAGMIIAADSSPSDFEVAGFQIGPDFSPGTMALQTTWALAPGTPSLIVLQTSREALDVLTALAARNIRAISLDDPRIAASALPSVLHALTVAGVVAIITRSDFDLRTVGAASIIQDMLAAQRWLDSN